MADYVSSLDNPITPSASSSGAADDSYEDACSICLDPFNTQDPPTVTNCKHEYHLQCILDWSQRSKECPICWQLLVLKDPASQELLAAVESERNSRSRRISPTAPTIVHNFHEDFEIDHDAPYTNDSDFNERIMRHLAAAATRARYVSRRERQRSSGLGPSQVLVFGPPTNVPDLQQTPTTSPEERQNLGYGLSDGDSPTSSLTSTVSGQPPSSGVPSAVNPVSSTAVNRDGPFKPSHPQPDSPQRLRPSELLAFSESFKSRLSAASTRYKESISKNARGFKEKLLARNNSVKELSKGVQREMSAGIAGVARMIERLDPTSKRTGVSVSVPSSTGGTSNISYKGKDVQENVIAQSVDGNNGENAHDMSSDAPSYVSGFIPGRLEVSHAQSGH